MIQKIKNNKAIIVIILLAALLRFYGISRGDPMNDESLMVFRSIGMIDFDEAAWQTTPFEWFDPLVKFSPTVPETYRIGTGIPWWTHLSWHDHPALVFIVQNIFISIFGEHTWAFRLPSAVLGVFSVYLLFLLGKRIYNERVGLFSALIYAVTLNAIYIARTGMQESYVIFFILLTLYLFFFALDLPASKKKYFLATGIVLGLGALAKYTTFFAVVPIILVYLIFLRRDVLQNKKFWFGVILFFIVISPSVIYNFELYRLVHHFDFQFSTIFQQAHPVWQVQPGKDIGNISDRVRAFVPHMIETNSWLFLSLFAMSVLGFLLSLLRNCRQTIQRHFFLIIAFICMIALLLGIGPSYRFLTMLAPFMALAVSVLLASLMLLFTTNIFLLKNFSCLPANWQAGSRRRAAQGFTKTPGLLDSIESEHAKQNQILPAGSASYNFAGTAYMIKGVKLILICVLAGVVIFEIFYSWNNQIAYYPQGREPWIASKVRYENYNWGYNELNNYFENEFKNKIPALTFDLRYQFLDILRDNALESGLQKGYQKYPALVVYYGNFDQAGRLWTLDRLHIYHAWPIISLDDYNDYLQKNGPNFYTEAGFKNYYFVMPTNSIPTVEFIRLVQGAEIIDIKNPREDTAFIVYKKQF